MAVGKFPPFLCALIVSILAFGYFVVSSCDDTVFTSDAADYVLAARSGFQSLYFESQSVGLWGLISLYRNEPSSRAHLWDALERRGDNAAYRHFHVASPFYPTAIAASMNATPRVQRSLIAVEGALALALMTFALISLGAPAAPAVISSLVAASAPAVVASSSDVSPHPAFLLAMLLFAWSLARYLKKEASILPTAISLGAVVAMMELSVLAVIPLLLVPLWRRSVRGLNRAILAFAAAVFLFWPGGFTKGSYVLGYAVFFMQALFRRGKYFGNSGIVDTVRVGLQDSPLLLGMVLVVVAAGVVQYLRKQFEPAWAAFACLLAAFFAQGMLNRFHNLTYASHFVVFLCAAFALSIHQILQLVPVRRKQIATAIVMVVIGLAGIATGVHWRASIGQESLKRQTLSTDAMNVISYAQADIPRQAVILTNTEHEIWRLYLPENRVEQTLDTDTLKPRNPELIPADYWIILDPAEYKGAALGTLERVAGRFTVQHVTASDPGR